MQEEITGRFGFTMTQIKRENKLMHEIKVVQDSNISDSEIIIALETIAKDLRKQKENQYEQGKFMIQ